MKKLFVIIALTIVSVVSALAQSPSATTTAAQTIKAGESFTVTVNISKLDLSCFAQYQVKLPEGFTAKEISGASDNANFYFENGKVLYQWYKLPIDRSNIELRFTVTASNKVAAGKYQLPGYFSYQFNNRLGQVDTGLSVEVK
ncbi:MAG: hypothetical protein J5826_02460 [Bacteroidales bacterium]|nr:hypothetical protein [Bacteroidales bacterium]